MKRYNQLRNTLIMNKIIIRLIIVAIFFPFMVGCSKDDATSTIINNEINNDAYYVKYEISKGKQIGYTNYTSHKITLKDVDGLKTINIDNDIEWDGTYGPFKFGDKVSISVITDGRYSANVRICISKNKEAFTIKAEERDSRKSNLEYTIDF